MTRTVLGLSSQRGARPRSTCQTAADGTFTVPRLPAVGCICASVTASGFGSPRIAWNLAEPVSLRLERAGSVRGTVAVSAGAVVPTTLKLSLYTASEGAKTGGAAFRVSHQTTTFPAKDGKFAFEGVPPGNCTIQAELYRSNLPYYAPKPTRVEVKPAETAMIEVQLLPAIAVRGRVVDAANGHGIQGVEVSVEHYADKRGHPSSWRDTTTDANGRFVGYSEPGRITAYAGGVPGADYAPDVGRSWPTMVATADVTWPTFKLERVVQLEGIVVDEAQKPVPDTEVQALVACHGEQSPRVQRTDANGRFVVRGLDAQQMLSLRARSAAGTSNALDLRPAEASAPVRLVLSSQNAFTLKGVCVDEAGRPVRKAEAGVRSPWMLGPTGLFVSVGNCETDARGRFQIGPLWPGFEYDVNVTSAGYAKYQSRRVKGQPGQMHDLGKIVLVDQSGFVDGRVIDSAGLPLAGVQVFLHREAVKPQRTTTDAAGRFRLEGLRFGRTFVCAQKEGYRLQAVATTSRTTGLSVTLLRRDEPVPPWKPRRPPASSDEEQAVARRLLEKLYAVPKKGPTSRSYRFMARLDPSRAVQLRRNGGRVDDETQRMAAEKIADADVDEAIALLTRSDNYQTFATLISLATHYAKSDAAKAQRLAEEAVLMARKLDQPDRTTALAEAGSMAVKLGHVEAGRKLIAEAAEMAAKMAASGRHAYVRINLATALAPYDLDRALSLVEPLAANDKERAAGADRRSHRPQPSRQGLGIVVSAGDEIDSSRQHAAKNRVSTGRESAPGRAAGGGVDEHFRRPEDSGRGLRLAGGGHRPTGPKVGLVAHRQEFCNLQQQCGADAELDLLRRSRDVCRPRHHTSQPHRLSGYRSAHRSGPGHAAHGGRWQPTATIPEEYDLHGRSSGPGRSRLRHRSAGDGVAAMRWLQGLRPSGP